MANVGDAVAHGDAGLNAHPLAVVIGGSRGIGAACVEALLHSGKNVAFTYTSEPPAGHAFSDAARAAGVKVLPYRLNITDASAVDHFFREAAKDFGQEISSVIANAGINVPPFPISQFPDDAFRNLIEVNVIGAFNVLRAAARTVAEGGSIVAITTSLTRHAVPGMGPYSASKAAVECLVRSMSKELAARRVRVNAVAPGPVDTDLFRAGKTEEAKARSAALSPLNRVGQPPEIAQVVAFLLSENASWVDGQILAANGGMV